MKILIHLDPIYAIEVNCRGKLLSFSLIDIDEQQYSFYQNIFFNYTLNYKDIRKEKLRKIDSLRNE